MSFPITVQGNVGNGFIFPCPDAPNVLYRDKCGFSSESDANSYCLQDPLCMGVLFSSNVTRSEHYPIRMLAEATCPSKNCRYSAKVVANATITEPGLWPSTLLGNFWAEEIEAKVGPIALI